MSVKKAVLQFIPLAIIGTAIAVAVLYLAGHFSQPLREQQEEGYGYVADTPIPYSSVYVVTDQPTGFRFFVVDGRSGVAIIQIPESENDDAPPHNMMAFQRK